MADWDEDSPRLRENIAKTLRDARAHARARATPSVEMARGWQKTTMRGLDVPDALHVGRFRGEAGLEGCEVRIGRKLGVTAPLVGDELAHFERKLRQAIETLDAAIAHDVQSGEQLAAVIETCAWAHAEWVRIHPFANGNGRTARLWANYIAMRYGLPPFVRVRPRPGDGYGMASAAAMDGDWQPMVAVFVELYKTALKT